MAVTLVGLLACADDETEVPEALRGETTCMWIAGTELHFEDGSSTLLNDPDTGLTGAVCTCMTREEYDAGGWEEDLSLQALDRCEELAARYEHEWNECQEDYESGEWFTFVFWGDEGLKVPARNDPGCAGD